MSREWLGPTRSFRTREHIPIARPSFVPAIQRVGLEGTADLWVVVGSPPGTGGIEQGQQIRECWRWSLGGVAEQLGEAALDRARVSNLVYVEAD